jgi:tRNA threonylcarbamoyladenosine biosynthesis protein TsaB
LNRPNVTASERLVLAVDTSTKATSFAIARGAELLKSVSAATDEKRSERLWSEVQALLAGLGLRITDVDAFAVCVGPGGFTGLRVGMAAAKGFAVAQSKPIVGVTSLEAAAFASGPAPHVCAMVSAYKNEVYSQLFSVGSDATLALPVALNDPLVSTFEKALDRVADLKELIFSGDGAEAGAEIIEHRSRMLGDVKWVIHQSDNSGAEVIARIALLRYELGEPGAAESLKACYVRPAEAEIKLSLGLLGSKIKRSMKSE